MKKAIILAGLQFGDEGKGSVTDFLTNHHKSKLVVRYNGGAQAAHNVVVNGKHFCFNQLSSGSIAGADTLLLDTMIVNPLQLFREYKEYSAKFDRLPTIYIHENALITTPYHIYANRWKESKLKHGSCGMGVWETVEYERKYSVGFRISDLKLGIAAIESFVMLRTLRSENRIENDDHEYDENYVNLMDDDWDDEFQEAGWTSLARWYYHVFLKMIHVVNDEQCRELLDKENVVVFEGAQGVLLDKDRGFLPHVSATDTTTHLAEAFLQRIGWTGEIEKIGLLRSYVTRHGNGPLPSEVENASIENEHNQYNEWQLGFRVGKFDLDLVKKALDICPVDSIFISCLDNDPFKPDDYVYNRALELSGQIGIPLKGYSAGRERSDKTLIYDNKKTTNIHI